ncbi:MAG: thioesterase [Lachnoclostridium sp.]|nr:thioesterase [Lachnoclostridium sp.]
MQQYFDNDFTLNAADCNAQRELSVSRISTLIIDTATRHALALGVGFDNMMKYGLSWVLSRLTFELYAPTVVGHSYRFRTWVAGLNRLFSERNFEIIDLTTDTTIGYARTIWMAINMETREAGDLSQLSQLREVISDFPCPIKPQGKFPLPELTEDASSYRFAVSDIDVNRHVTTHRYIDLITDCWELGRYDSDYVTRFEIAFRQEARYGETARYCAAALNAEAGEYVARIDCGDHTCAASRLIFKKRAEISNLR